MHFTNVIVSIWLVSFTRNLDFVWKFVLSNACSTSLCRVEVLTTVFTFIMQVDLYWHPHLRTGGFYWSKVLQLACLLTAASAFGLGRRCQICP